MTSFRSYVILLVSLVGTSLLAIAAVNLAVDPYDALGIRIQRFNAKKLALDERPKFAKPFMVLRTRPDAAIFGSSRPAHALRTDHACWSTTNQKVFNLAVEGTTIYETLRLLQHASASGALKRAVIELDPNSFWSKSKVREGFEDRSLLGPGNNLSDVLLTYIGALISWEMSRASLHTITNQSSHPMLVDYDGRRNDISFERAVQKAGGQRALFRKIETIAYINPLLDEGLPDVPRATIDARGSPFDTFREILALGRERGIDLRFYLSPVHARQLELYRAIGVSDAFANWKRRLVEITEAERVASGSDSSFPIWDFSQYSRITVEPIPALDAHNERMRGYWETTHYTTTVGDSVLNEVLGCVDEDASTSIGVMLTARTVSSLEDALRAGSRRYRVEQPGEVAEVEEAVADARRRRLGLRTQIPGD